MWQRLMGLHCSDEMCGHSTTVQLRAAWSLLFLAYLLKRFVQSLYNPKLPFVPILFMYPSMTKYPVTAPLSCSFPFSSIKVFDIYRICLKNSQIHSQGFKEEIGQCHIVRSHTRPNDTL